MSYLKQHWKGELPLALSFWLNMVVVGLCVYGLSLWARKSSPIEDPVLAARVYVSLLYFVFFIIFPWQAVGVWRASRRYTKKYTNQAWGEVVRLVIVLAVLRVLGYAFFPTPILEARLKIGFGKDQFADYHVSLTHSGTLIHVQGPLGFGVSKKIKRLIDPNDNINGIILDSSGGWLYEGRKLATIILNNRLDTYSTYGCASACTLAYIAGKQRYLVQGAKLGFHQYYESNKKLEGFFDLDREQHHDLRFFQSRGITPSFAEKIFKAEKNEIWHPGVEELLKAGVVHKLISDIGAGDLGMHQSQR